MKWVNHLFLLSRELQPAIDKRPNFTRDNNSCHYFVLQKKHVGLPLVGSGVLQNVASGGISSLLATESGRMLASADTRLFLMLRFYLMSTYLQSTAWWGGVEHKEEACFLFHSGQLHKFMLCLAQGMRLICPFLTMSRRQTIT